MLPGTGHLAHYEAPAAVAGADLRLPRTAARVRILVDCRYVRLDRHDGISRYTVGLAGALARLTRAGPQRSGQETAGQETAGPGPAGRHRLELLVSDARQLAHLPQAPWHLVSAPTSVREPFVARQVRRLHPDVVFTPMQTMGGWGRDYPLVVTLHDLIYHRHRTPPRELPASGCACSGAPTTSPGGPSACCWDGPTRW